MPDQPIPEPVPLAAGPLDPSRIPPTPAERPRCRALTVGGHRCKNKTMEGLHLCFSHYRNRRPALPEPRKVSVPLLEDPSAIQLIATQVLHGVLSYRLEPLRARAALYALRIATQCLARAGASAASAGEAVCRLGRDYQDFISADSDLADPPLNPSCSVPDSVPALRELLDTLETENRCDPELETEDLPRTDPTHDSRRCNCLTCTDYRDELEAIGYDARLRQSDRKERSRLDG